MQLFISRYKKLVITFVLICSGLSSPSVYPSVDGIFTGTVITDLSCSFPFEPGGFPEPTNISISLSTGPSGGVVNSVNMSSSHFVFNSISAGSYIDSPNPDGSIDLNGSIQGNMTVTFGSPNTDGTYTSPAPNFSFTAIFNTDGTLDLVFDTEIFYSGSPCSSGFIDFSLPATLTGTVPVGPTPSSDSTELTPSSTITRPETLKTQVRVITSDIQRRVNDVLRNIQLNRRQSRVTGRSNERQNQAISLLPTKPDREGAVDTSEQEDNQSAFIIQPTDSGFMMNSLTGLNAGDQGNYLFGAWASYSYTDFENDFTPTAFDGNRHGGLVGLDVSPWESVLFGVAVGYEDNDIDTGFNRGNQETDGYTIAPYFGALLTDTWSVNFSFGYSSLDTDQFRTLPGTTTQVTSSPESDRWFGMFNLNGLTTYGNWVIGGQIGFLYAKDEQDAYVESDGTSIAELNSELGQWNIGGDVAYSYEEFEPFARVLYENDFNQTELVIPGTQQPAYDNDDVVLGFGVRYFGANNLIGNIEFNTRLGREDYDEYSITATLRYEW